MDSFRKKCIIISLLLGILVVVAVTVVLTVVVASDNEDSRSNVKNNVMTSKQRAIAVLERVPLVDGHNDLPYIMRKYLKNQINDISMEDDSIPKKVSGTGYGHTTIPWLREGKVGGQFWAAYLDCKTREKNSIRNILEQIDVIKRFVEKYPDTFEFVTTADGIINAHKNKKVASLIGVEGGHAIDSSMGVLRMLYELGARYMTLTHSCNTPWADNWLMDDDKAKKESEAKKNFHNGITTFGKEIIKEMNRLGMLIDLSHVSEKTMSDVLNITKAPVIFSHSSAYSVCNHNRNVRDSILKKVKENDGVVMINFYTDYVNCSPNKTNKTTIQTVVSHFEHIKKEIGADYIGMGSDYDGVTTVPEGLENVSKFPDLLAALADKGWTDEELEKVAGMNLIRVFRKTEEVAKELKKKGKPSESLMSADDFLYPAAGNTSCRYNMLETY